MCGRLECFAMSKSWKSFFDESSDRDEPAAPSAAGGAIAVSVLVGRIKAALDEAFPKRVSVVAEISNLKRHSSGHLYFRLKDSSAAIDAVMFKSAADRMKFDIEDGMEVVADGRVDLYETRGQLQFYVDKMTPKGAGALDLAFRQLYAKLDGEGLFDPSHKKPTTQFPRAIGVVTSATGAAVRDIRRTLQRRWAGARVYLVSTLVQGDRAAGEIAEAVRLLDANAHGLDIDTIIVARGGGSLEDLWAFNEEIVARAIFAAETPIITGIGHEVDTTIADLVADRRAATPTAAAELAVPDADEVRRHVRSLLDRLGRGVRERLGAQRMSLQSVRQSWVFRDPLSRVRIQMQRIDELSHRSHSALRGMLAGWGRRLGPTSAKLAALHPAALCERARSKVTLLAGRLAWALGGRCKRSGDALVNVRTKLLTAHPKYRIKMARQQVDALSRHLAAMGYKNVIARGFSVTRTAGGQIVRSAGQVSPGEAIRSELADGAIESIVAGRAARQRRERTAAKKRSAADEPTLFDE